MVKPKDHDGDPKRRHERGHEDETKHSRRDERDEEESGDDPKRHASVIERRWFGSLPPTAKRLAHALRQWQSLPGAVTQPAADVTGDNDKPLPPEMNQGGAGSVENKSRS